MQHLQELEKLYQTYGLGPYFAAITPKARPAIRLNLRTATATDPVAVGDSKIGGPPDLPAGMEWPTADGRTFAFVAQFNLAQLAPYDVEGKLPPQGMLYFYFDEDGYWNYEDEDEEAEYPEFTRVVFYEGTQPLQRQPKPKHMGQNQVYKPCHLQPETQVDLPDRRSDYTPQNLSKEDLKNLKRLHSEQYIGLQSKLLGHANYLQDGMEFMLEAERQGLDPDEAYELQQQPHDPRTQALRQGMEGWVLLLQVDSEQKKAGLIWGDQGRAYFWIREEDLKNKDFSRVLFDMQDL